jgi:hypothetical protein
LAEASTTTVRTVISGAGAGSGQPAEEAAALLSGFEGVELDAEAETAIAAALLACAERAREASEALDQGGNAAADAAEDDPDKSFVRVGERCNPFRGELVPPVAVEEYVPFVAGEAPWRMAGAEVPAELARIEDEIARREAEGSEASGT